MDDWELSIYIREVINQAETVKMAAQDFNSTRTHPQQDSVPRAFMAVQSILAASSMISKLLWPNPSPVDRHCQKLIGEPEQQRKRTINRGKSLRKILVQKTDDTQPIEHNRTVRNAFEHFDERLDIFVHDEASGSRTVVDRNIIPKSVININGAEPRHLRRIDPTTVSISVLDNSVDLRPLVTLIERIQARAIEWLGAHDALAPGR